MRRLAAALALAAVLVVLPPTPAASSATPLITPQCSPVPVDCSGWFTVNVTVTWSISGATDFGPCAGGTVSSDTGGIQFTCEASNAEGTTIRKVTIKRDATPPSVSGASPSRGPDANGWYRAGFGVAFNGGDATSGVASCTSASYEGADTAGGSLSGTCTDVAGNTSAPGTFGFKYDATAPAITGASFSRQPDNRDWFTKAVKVTFAGADATSGIESCTAADYAGPDGAATVKGTCRDFAGNVSAEGAAALKYDGTAPQLRSVGTKRGNGFVELAWRSSADTAAIQVVRTPGANGAARTTLFRGKASSFRDRRIARNRRYKYVVTALDEAGNAASRTLSIVIRSALYRPANGQRVRGRALLAWDAAPRATYYNVQVYRGRTKVLTLWPGNESLRLRRLAPGRYRWYVWPGYGARSRRNYGGLLGSSAFTIVR